MAASRNIRWHEGRVDRATRWSTLGLSGATVWLTGLSGSGKSTLGAALEHALIDRKIACYRLDGDNLRHGLNADLGFGPEDRKENIRRASEVAALMADFGAVAIGCFISPYAEDRAAARARHETCGVPFYEVYVDTPLDVCEARDPKGLYAKARAGDLVGMTGVDAPYEVPTQPDLRIRGEGSVEERIQPLVDLLARREDRR